MGRKLSVLLGLVAGMLGPTAPLPAADVSQPNPAQVEFFEKSVRPVLATQCLGCHGPEKQKGGLRLDSRELMMRGGDSGAAIMPGDPEKSRLVEAIRYGDDLQMPPKGKLKEEQIASLTRWVKDGAYWPEAGAPSSPSAGVARARVTEQDRQFWSFRPVTNPPAPAVKDAAWPRSPIDRFVLARLEQAGLKPVEPADKRTLIRRATFDLTGLPPTPEEVEAFVRDESPEAFARVVDRLLASPRYGERWGRHWLDVARYGEDQAHTFEARKYPYGFRYRDWVVRALNDDMPYDRFIMEQIAGDLLDGPGRESRLAALGYFALGPVYYGRAVFDELDDRVDTLCRGFLGLTVSCARCHDHKFDPIPQKDYYSLAGVFASTQYQEYPQAPPDVVARYDRWQADLKAKTDEVGAFTRNESAKVSEALASQASRYLVAAWVLVNKRKADPAVKTAEVAGPEGLNDYFLDRWVKYAFPAKGDTRPHLANWRRLVAAQDPAVDLSGNEAEKGRVAEAARTFEAYLRSALRLRDAIEAHQAAAKANGLGGEAAAKGPVLDADAAKVLEEVVAANGVFAVPKDQVDALLPAEARATLKALRAEMNRLKKEAPAKYPVIHSLAEGTAIANMRVHLRGNPEALGDEAPRRFLAILSDESTPPFQQGSGRLELARAIASPDNPLTARVMVNRIWEHHFGRGLVATPSNFGRMGEAPTHPELLDWLASRFLAVGWSMKALHREILLSATYQLSSRGDATSQEVDPDNRLLWRMNRRRLEVEPWRDAMLAVSGTLDPTVGGPSVELTSAENRRRTLYAAVSRHNLDGLLRLFDFPDPNITADRRVVTTVPLQQLFVLNSDFMERQARALVAKLCASPGESDADRVRRAFAALYGRPATDLEVQWGVEFLAGEDAARPAEGRDADARTRWEQYAQVLLGTNEFAFVD